MQNIIWRSEPIRLSEAVSVEVHVLGATDDAPAAVVLGQTANHVFAADLELTAEASMALADVLTQGAVKCLAAQGRTK